MKAYLACASAAAIAMAIGAPAHAQDVQETAEESAGIGVIVVTAQRRSENVQDVPIAITAIGSEFLETRGIDSIDKLGTLAPNVKFERAPSSKSISQIAIRGSVTINPAITWEPAVGLYLDGVYIAKAQGSIFDIADLERVEILRGPQGTLYGRNALSGAVNLVTKKPSGEAGGLLQVTYGSYNEAIVRGVVDLPQTGIFSAKVSGQYRRRDGLIALQPGNPSGLDRVDSVDSGSFMVQLRAELASNVTADYTFDYSKLAQTPPFSQLLAVNRNGDPRDIFDPNSPSFPFAGAFFPLHTVADPERVSRASIDAPVSERSRSYGHALTLTVGLGAAELKSITAYRNLKWSDGLDLDGSPFPVAATQRFSDYDAFSQELQLAGEAFGDRLNYVLGAFYFTESAETRNPQRYFGGATDLDSNYGSNTDAFALFAQADVDLTERLQLTLGARYTHEKKDISRFFRINQDLANGIVAPLVVADLPTGSVPDATFEDFSPAATLSYEVTDDIYVYARYARGFKSGGFNGESNVFAAPTPDCPSGALELCAPYRPEVVNSYEIGLKSQFLDNRLILNLAAFRNDIEDMQLSVFTATTGAASIVQNAAGAQIQGLEVEAVLRPVDALTINASLAFLDPEYKSFIDGGVDVAGNRAFPHAPKTTVAIGADWNVASGDWGRLNLFGDVSYASEYFTFPFALTAPNPSDQVAETSRSPGRTIVNLRATVAEIPVGASVEAEVSLFVRNLTDENQPSNFIDFGPGFGGLLIGYFPDPRTYGMTVGVRF